MLSNVLVKGQIIELKVQEELLRYGFDISIPSYNASRYDMIADTGIELLKIQVKKSIQVSDNSFKFSCTSANNIKSANSKKHKYTKNEVDYFATVWNNVVYLIPIDETSCQKTIHIDDTQYIAENVLCSYDRLPDEELYNYANRKHKYCIDCGREISQNSERCMSCRSMFIQSCVRPTKETLKHLIRNESFTTIGKKYSVTDNAVRKWCDYYGLPRKKGDINKYSKEEWEAL